MDAQHLVEDSRRAQDSIEGLDLTFSRALSVTREVETDLADVARVGGVRAKQIELAAHIDLLDLERMKTEREANASASPVKREQRPKIRRTGRDGKDADA